MIKYVNHPWEINKYKYKELRHPVGLVNDLFQLIRNNTLYVIPSQYIACYVPLNKYYIRMDKVNKYLERIEQ